MTTSPNDYEQLTEGVQIRFLRRAPDGGMTFFIRMKKGAHAPRHAHPGGEETCVLSGTLRIEQRIDHTGATHPDLVVSAGDYAFAPAGETHEGVALEDTVFFVVAPAGVVPCVGE
jgi:quercetin dioxygenase-like cupin family protein